MLGNNVPIPLTLTFCMLGNNVPSLHIITQHAKSQCIYGILFLVYTPLASVLLFVSTFYYELNQTCTDTSLGQPKGMITF